MVAELLGTSHQGDCNEGHFENLFSVNNILLTSFQLRLYNKKIYLNDFSETTLLVVIKLHMEHPWNMMFKVC